MPHSTTSERRLSMNHPPSYKFPADDGSSAIEPFPDHDAAASYPSFSPSDRTNGASPAADQWQPGKDRSYWASSKPTRGHGRQQSLSDALKNIRARRGSMTANAHELADALKAPVSPTLVILCVIWYLSSALTNTSSKTILNAYPMPATLTLIQFVFVSGYCLFFGWLATVFPGLKTAIPALRHGIRYPSREVIVTTLPLAAFQIGGHLLSSTATAKIPVSLVHTIKGLSPLFTVFAYRVLFNIEYPIATYLSLIPLTLGVMLACSAEFKGNILGIIHAFLATIIFVTQNIFSKRLFNDAAKAEADAIGPPSRKLDKLNLLCYSSGMAFLLTFPLWLWSEGIGILSDFMRDGVVSLNDHPEAYDHGRLALEYFFNGTFHFGQNLLAFILLSMVSPVTYSVASLVKRVFVVVIAIIWFQNSTTKIQAAGIGLTFAGLYFYDRTSDHNKADRKAKMMDTSQQDMLLPLNTRTVTANPIYESPSSSAHPYNNAFSNGSATDDKKSDDRHGRPRGASNATWLPPGTKQEETWKPRDAAP